MAPQRAGSPSLNGCEAAAVVTPSVDIDINCKIVVTSTAIDAMTNVTSTVNTSHEARAWPLNSTTSSFPEIFVIHMNG